MPNPTAATTFLFTDIEGSTRMWEESPERMRPALACHDALARTAVEGHGGSVVKMIGNGVHAAFADPLDALGATLQLQQALADPGATGGVSLRVRCGVHLGEVERRDNDFFGTAVNRAARLMAAAHGGQVIVSQAVVDRVAGRLPQAMSLRDLGSVRLRDLARPEHVFQVVHPELPQDFPALRSLEATPNNLAQQVTSFVGRERELAEVKALLATTRLATLQGAGGLGKTRLSLHVAVEVLERFADGVWLVELATLADGRLLAQAVATVLGVKEEAGRPVQEALLKFVGDRQLLLVLDNCEHLLPACAELAGQLLQAGAQVKILATSREPLHVAGEATYPVPPLSIPEPRLRIAHTALTQYDAVRLFVDRAVAAQPAFVLTAQNAARVSDICRHLDGIPLALELAAARVRAMSVETIAGRLSDRFRLLTGGDRTALPRQQTLRACIDWSYDLLTEPERCLLRRLAVFAGGFTLEAADAVAAGGGIAGDSVLDLTTQLVEKSLVAIDAEGRRYRLLETVRQYADDRLREAGDGDAVGTRHLDFYLALAKKARPELHGPDQAAWQAQLDLERENLLAAHAWCDRAVDGAVPGLTLVHALQNYWLNCGLQELGYRLNLEALARAGAQAHSALRGNALFAAGFLGYWMGRYDESRRLLEESLAIDRETGDLRGIVAVLAWLGHAAHGQGDLARARDCLEEAVARGREVPGRGNLPQALTALAELCRATGDLDAAEPLYEEALALQREECDGSNIAASLVNLAMVAIGRGGNDRARERLREAQALAEELGFMFLGRATLDVCAGLAASGGEYERAARLLGVGQAQLEKLGVHRDPADEAFLAPLMARAREALGAAAFERAETRGRAISYADAMAEARAWLAPRS